MVALRSLATICGFVVATSAVADEKRDWDLTIGVATAYAPDYSGATATSFRLIVWADGALKTQELGTVNLDSGSLTVAPEVRWDLVDSREASIGPLIGYRSGRNDKNPEFADATDGNGAPRGLPNVSSAFDAGIAGHVTVLGVPFFAQLRSALSGPQGALAILGVYLPVEPAPDVELTILPTVTWANARQMRAFYGVSTTASAASGLEAYNPGGGWENAAIEIATDWHVSGGWHVIGSVAFQRLLGNAARSPIVSTANQTSALLGVAFQF